MYKIKYSNLNQNAGSSSSSSSSYSKIKFGDFELPYEDNYEFISIIIFFKFNKYILPPATYQQHFNFDENLLEIIDKYFKFYNFEKIVDPTIDHFRVDSKLFEQKYSKVQPIITHSIDPEIFISQSEITKSDDLTIIDDNIPKINDIITQNQSIFLYRVNEKNDPLKKNLIKNLNQIIESDYEILKIYRNIVTSSFEFTFTTSKYFNNITNLINNRNIIFDRLEDLMKQFLKSDNHQGAYILNVVTNPQISEDTDTDDESIIF
jgi:hypothetical protein